VRGAPGADAGSSVCHSSASHALDHLVARADAALLNAKRQGRNRVVAHLPEMAGEMATRPDA